MEVWGKGEEGSRAVFFLDFFEVSRKERGCFFEKVRENEERGEEKI